MATPQGRQTVHDTPSGATLLSCDVFDTVLTRRIGSPAALFLILGKRLATKGLIRSSPEAFARTRIEANRRARANAGRGMGLADIYLELQFTLGLSDADREAIRAEEVALESELLVPVPGAADRLRRAREAGMAVAFLSDMYLDSAFIRSQLARHDMIAAGDGCYVSCEEGCGKGDGRAYRVMAMRESVDLGNVVHRGNDPRADVSAARSVGVTAEPFLAGNLNRFEAVLETHSYPTEGLSSVMAGASRLARLSVPAPDGRQTALRDVAASVGGPVLVSYVLWVLLRARDRGIRRLYFMARDGYLLMRVARSLIQALGLDCEARYLHGGIKAWDIPTTEGVSGANLFGEAAERRQDALSYFRQEGVFDGSAWALVDLGWSGRLPGAMDRILRADGGGVPAAFFFARFVDEESHAPGHAVPIHAYFSDHDNRRGHPGRLNELFVEMFCGADQGEVVGYRRHGDGMVPILASETNPALSRWGLPIIHETILSFVDRLWLDADGIGLAADMRPAVADVLRLFIASPSPAEARAWGMYPVEYGSSGAVGATIATPFTIRELPHAVRHGQIRPRSGTEWIEGGLAITPPMTRALLKSSLALRRRLFALGRKGKRALSRASPTPPRP
jgi:FMN phosphatase YigB (HAD superfamily)